MNIQKSLKWIAPFIIGAMFVGCGDSGIPPTAKTEADLISEAIDSDPENSVFFASDFDDEENEEGTDLSKPTMEKLEAVGGGVVPVKDIRATSTVELTPLQPVDANATSTRWFRKMDPSVRTVSIATSTATSTTVTITKNITGNLSLIPFTPDCPPKCPPPPPPCFQLTPTKRICKKDFSLVHNQTARFKINDDTSSSTKRRELIEISPRVISMKDPTKQTIHIKEVTMKVRNEGVVTGTVKVNNGNRLMPVQNIPTFNPGDEVLITATIENKDNPLSKLSRPSKVYLHFPVEKGAETATRTVPVKIPPMKREPMFDDGTHGDEVAGDGVFSVLHKIRKISITPTSKMNPRIVIVDGIDGAVFDDETADNYNAESWVLFYRESPTISGELDTKVPGEVAQEVVVSGEKRVQ